jgi:hypothetical protein
MEREQQATSHRFPARVSSPSQTPCTAERYASTSHEEQQLLSDRLKNDLSSIAILNLWQDPFRGFKKLNFSSLPFQK